VRNRCIKPGFWKDEQVALCSREARLLFTGLWGLSDAWGVLEDRPRRIRVELLPYDDLVADQVVAWIDELAAVGLVERYVADGRPYLWIPGLRDHQLTSMPSEERRVPPRLPLPHGVVVVGDLKSGAATVARPTTNLRPTSEAPMGTPDVPQLGMGDGGRGTGDGGRGTGAAPEAPRRPAAAETPEIRLAAWVTVRSRDADREAENRACLRQLVEAYGERAVQRAAEAWVHRERAKAYPDQLVPILAAAADESPTLSEDLALVTARALVAEHGWQRVLAASDLPPTRNPDEETFLANLAGNLPVCRKLPARLQALLAGGSAS